ncbi:ParB N-terminal domain-containing protein [Corynebacterium lubricantis]|uniref:ParB N-terminal domain-containing protein n=1 Tax=Corynebacterium lubricantis TaxID=541095 RepID=UPI000380B799|nr:ParB N-terminal domain-containing protein [Corynebacterium lubricantis]
MSNAVRYQVMPPLASDEYQELYEDIKANGVLEPIHVDEDGVVIDGHHRSKIASELGIPCPMITHDDLDEGEKVNLAFVLNLKRRHLSREQRQELVVEYAKRRPLASDSEIAKATGASDKTVKQIKADSGLPSRKEVIADEIAKFPESTSSREIARELGVSQTTVSDMRSVQNSEIPNFGQTEDFNTEPSTPRATALPQADLDEPNQPEPAEPVEPEKPVESDKPRAEPITKQFTSAIVDLNRVMAKFDRIQNDPNFPRNKEKVAALHRHDLNRSISELQALADQLN